MMTTICNKLQRKGTFCEHPPANLVGAVELNQFLKGHLSEDKVILTIRNSEENIYNPKYKGHARDKYNTEIDEQEIENERAAKERKQKQKNLLSHCAVNFN